MVLIELVYDGFAKQMEIVTQLFLKQKKAALDLDGLCNLDVTKSTMAEREKIFDVLQTTKATNEELTAYVQNLKDEESVLVTKLEDLTGEEGDGARKLMEMERQLEDLEREIKSAEETKASLEQQGKGKEIQYKLENLAGQKQWLEEGKAYKEKRIKLMKLDIEVLSRMQHQYDLCRRCFFDLGEIFEKVHLRVAKANDRVDVYDKSFDKAKLTADPALAVNAIAELRNSWSEAKGTPIVAKTQSINDNDNTETIFQKINGETMQMPPTFHD